MIHSELYTPFPTPQDLESVRDARKRWLHYIEVGVDRFGYAEVSDPYNLDDPPYPKLLEIALILDYFDGHSPIEQQTAMGELRKLADVNNWELTYHRDYILSIRAPMKKWICPSCEGRCIQPASLRNLLKFAPDPAAMVMRRCSQCSGIGYVVDRINPKYAYTLIEFRYGHWMPKQEER